MFEREIQRAKELLTQRLAAAQQFVYWQEIRERADIPVFYRNFFGAEVQWWVFEEQLQRAANPRFDYAHEQLALHTVEADRYRMEAARFDHQDLTSAIDLAVKTRFNYILRPRTTLKWFVYRGEPTKTLSEVLLRMDYFLEYDYLLDGFRKWIAMKQQEPTTKQSSLISVVEFDRTLQGVDNDVILEYSPEEFTDLLTPIYEMFDDIHATDRALQQYHGKVPMPAIIVFLDDKGIYRIAQELEDMMKTRALRYIGQREFLHLLNDIVNKLEQETPVIASEHTDPATLPLAFDDEPIIKADDTIGELALGAAKRKPKPSLPSENAASESIPLESEPPPKMFTDEEIEAFDEPLTMTNLPEAFGTELAGLAAMMENMQPTHNAVETADEAALQGSVEKESSVQELPPSVHQAELHSAAQAEIHDAEYVVLHPQQEEEHRHRLEQTHDEAALSEGAANTLSSDEPPTAQPNASATTTTNTEPPKSGLFARWSSIFVPRSDE